MAYFYGDGDLVISANECGVFDLIWSWLDDGPQAT